MDNIKSQHYKVKSFLIIMRELDMEKKKSGES